MPQQQKISGDHQLLSEVIQCRESGVINGDSNTHTEHLQQPNVIEFHKGRIKFEMQRYSRFELNAGLVNHASPDVPFTHD